MKSVLVSERYAGIVAMLPGDSNEMTESEWSRLVACLDATGRFFLSLPPVPAVAAAEAVVESLGLMDQMSDARQDLETAKLALTTAIATAPPPVEFTIEQHERHLRQIGAEIDRALTAHLKGVVNEAQAAAVAFIRGYAAETVSAPTEPIVEPVSEPIVEPDAPVEEVASLSDRQAQIVDALRETSGDQKAAAEKLGLSTGNISGTISALRSTRRLPADVAALLDVRRAVRDREAAAVRDVAERTREPHQNEKSEESFEDRRARLARERANATMDLRRTQIGGGG